MALEPKRSLMPEDWFILFSRYGGNHTELRLFSATVSAGKRWMGWAVILAALLSVTALSPSVALSLNATSQGLEISFILLSCSPGFGTLPLLSRTLHQ
jgi:hypothetical protein